MEEIPDPFLATGFPVVDALLETSRQVVEGGGSAFRRPLSDSLQNAYTFCKDLTTSYEQARGFRWRTHLFRQVDPRARAQLEDFKASLKLINRYFEDQRTETVRHGCQQLRRAVLGLIGSLEALKQEEETRESASDSPYLDRLAYLATGVAEGRLPHDALQPYLEWFLPHISQARKDLETISTSAQPSGVAEIVDRVKPAMEKLGRLLGEFAEAYHQVDAFRIKYSLREILEVGQQVHRDHHLLQERLAPSPVCSHCGHENPPGSKVCGHCGARLITEATGPVSSVSVVAGDGTGPPQFAYVVRLEDAVEAFLRDEVEIAELAQVVSWFGDNVRAGRQDFLAEIPPTDYPDEASQSTAEAAHALMDEGGKLLVSGVEGLEKFLLDQERELLDAALESIRQGAAKVGESQDLLETLF